MGTCLLYSLDVNTCRGHHVLFRATCPQLLAEHHECKISGEAWSSRAICLLRSKVKDLSAAGVGSRVGLQAATRGSVSQVWGHMYTSRIELGSPSPNGIRAEDRTRKQDMKPFFQRVLETTTRSSQKGRPPPPRVTHHAPSLLLSHDLCF